MTTMHTQPAAPPLSLELWLAEDADGWMPCRGETPVRYRRAGDPLVLNRDARAPWDRHATAAIDLALEDAFRLANIGETDDPEHGAWVATYRDRDRARSLSVGDAVVVNGELGYTVDSFGFRPMTVEERAVLAASR